MRKLFRNLERHQLDYLLISGQAAVLYGAATFSEDIDIWIRPSAGHPRRFLRALADCRASVHKLTPPLTRKHIEDGHGFHFTIPSPDGPVYLDALGSPPRVGPFVRARERSEIIETPWGPIPVIAIPDLVAMKKTRRLSDYEVISDLVRIHLGNPDTAPRARLRWAARETFRAEDRVTYLDHLGKRAGVEASRREIAERIARLQARDTAYWKRRTAALRTLRRQEKLLPEGTPVAELIGKPRRTNTRKRK